jgi:hypothetical protein
MFRCQLGSIFSDGRWLLLRFVFEVGQYDLQPHIKTGGDFGQSNFKAGSSGWLGYSKG